MSDNQPIENFWEEWNLDPTLSSGQQLYASGATGGGSSAFGMPSDKGQSGHQQFFQPDHNIGTPGNSAGPHDEVHTFNEHICYRCSPFVTFNRLGDLTRHQKEKHNPVTASKYLCPINLCPRGVQGEGFGRMHHLVAHLKSKKHGMQSNEAAYLARTHNLPKSKGQAVTQAGS